MREKFPRKQMLKDGWKSEWREDKHRLFFSECLTVKAVSDAQVTNCCRFTQYRVICELNQELINIWFILKNNHVICICYCFRSKVARKQQFWISLFRSFDDVLNQKTGIVFRISKMHILQTACIMQYICLNTWCSLVLFYSEDEFFETLFHIYTSFNQNGEDILACR